MSRRHLLVVDDDPAVRRSLGLALEDRGLKVSSAANAAEGLSVFERGAHDLVLLDLFLPDQHGLEVLRQIKAKDPDAAVIVVTASDDVRDAVEAMKRGAVEYLVKPYDLDALMVLIDHALEQRRTRIELGAHKKSQSEKYTFEAIEASSPASTAAVALAAKLAQNATVTILIEGETGVGKEFVARALHQAGPRSPGPFVAVSCAAIPETLLESELFGHEAGAFTDARTRKNGLIELAVGGTLFLDEIGEMPMGMQAKLLRVIETHTFRRVGGTDDLDLDARIVAATNVEMDRAVGEKRFREDLYYRLKVGHLRIPPLRERRDDVLPLARRLLGEICREMGRRPLELSARTCEAFLRYRWPGNVRELRNVLERAAILQESDEPVAPVHLPPEVNDGGPAGVRRPVETGQPLAEVEREHILGVFEACGRNHTKAARRLGISRTTLWEKLKSYRVSAEG